MPIVGTGQITIADVNDGAASRLTTDSFNLVANSAGVVANYTGAETQFKITEGILDTTNNWSYYISATGGGISYRDSDDAADRTSVGQALGGLGGTNLLTNSNSVTSATGTTFLADQVLDPYGNIQAGHLTANTASTSHEGIIGYTSWQSSTTYTLSGFIKQNPSSNVNGINGSSSSAIGGVGVFNYNFSTKIGTGATFTEMENGWIRFSVTFVPTASVSASYFIRPTVNGSTSFTGQNTGFYIWGLQLEASTSASELNLASGSPRSGIRGYVKVTSLTQDNSYLDITAVKVGGSSITKRFNLSRSKAGVSPIVGNLTNPGHIFSASSDGTVSDYAGGSGVFEVYEGTTLITSGVTYSIPTTPVGITAEITNAGVYTLSDMTTNGSTTVKFRAVYKGVTIDQVYSATKSRTASNGQRGSTTIEIATTETSWNSAVVSQIDSYFTTYYSAVKVLNDRVTVYNTSANFSQTRYWDNTGWIQAASVVDGNLIVTGTVTGDKFAANSITTNKLLVTGQGNALNSDPNTQDITAWTSSGSGTAPSFSIVTVTDGVVGNKALQGTGGVHVLSRTIPVDATKKYRVRCRARRSSDALGTFYLRLYQYDASGAQVEIVAGFEGVALTTEWQTFTSSTITLNPGTISAKVAVVLNWNNTAGYMQAQDIRCEQVIGGDLIVDGAITGNKIAANSITADKIVIGAQGTCINDDPMFIDASAWIPNSTSVVFNSNTSASNAVANTYIQCATGTDVMITSAKRYPIGPGKVYRLSANLYAAGGNNRNMYLFVQFYDYGNNYIDSSVTGWGGTKSGYTYGGTPPVDVWTRLGGQFGTGTGRAIPASARYCEIGVWFQYSGGSGSTQLLQACQDLRLEECVTGELVVNGSIVADKIDTRGLSIKDADGNVILSAGSPLSSSNITAAPAWINTNITISGGNIQGIGTGSGTAVANSSIGVNASGQLTGIGTGNNTAVANNQISIDTSGNIAGIGTGTGQSVSNNVDNVIRAPGGGVYVTTTSSVVGAIKIRLPQFFTNTMMRFTVEVYEYLTGFMCTIEIGGYNYQPNSTWYNVSARVIGGSNVEYPVYFGHDGTKCCVWIGAYNEGWSYPQVRIRDFFAGYSNYAASNWSTGWQISFDETQIASGTGTDQYSAVVTDTFPGADWSKTARRPANLSALGGTENIQNSQITISSGAIQGIGTGSGTAVANSSISINSNGTLTGAGSGQVTLPGMGLRTFRVGARGLLASGYPIGSELRDADTNTVLVSAAAMYRVVKINRSTGVLTNVGGYNTLSGGVAIPGDMAAALNAIGNDHIVIVFSYDEPQGNRLNSGLDSAMYRCGASRAVFGSPNFKYRGAYILIGIPGVGEGNGFEAYAGDTDSDINAWCDVAFSIRNGNIIVSGTSSTPRTIGDYGYTGALDANKTYVDGSGKIQGVSSGADTTVANNQISISTAGNIAGIGTGDGQSVANNVNSRIMAPAGGIYTSTSSSIAGAIRIRLPAKVNTDYPMVKFTVEIYEYVYGYSTTMSVSGHTSGTGWYNVSAQLVAGNIEYPVSFGHDGTYFVIWIGSNSETWSYPQVFINNVLIGYTSMSASLWSSNWEIAFDTQAPTNVTGTVSDTYPAADWSKTARRPANLSALGGTENIQNSQITISSGAIQGIGTGSGTTVANSSIAVDASGQLTGIGTGNNTTVANNQITISSGAIQGIGTGSGTAVANSSITVDSNGVLQGTGTPSVVVDNRQVGSTNLLWGPQNGVQSAGPGAYGVTVAIIKTATSNVFGLEPGEKLTISADLWQDTTSANNTNQTSTLYLYSARADGTWIAAASISGNSGNTDKVRRNGTLTLPATASDITTVAVGLYHIGSTNATEGIGTVYADRIQLERGPSATLYSPGAEPGATNTYIDSNGTIRGVSSGVGTTVANNQITISSGAIQGIGTGSGTTVANSSIAVNASGQLTGIGTGNNTAVANNQITISSGAIQGIGTGSGTTVANSSIAVNASGQLTGIGTGNSTTVANSSISVNASGQLTGIGTGNNTTVDNTKVTLSSTGQLLNGTTAQGQITTLTIPDTRSTNEAPSWYSVGTTTEFKTRTVIGAPGTGTYGVLRTEKAWADASGGAVVQTFKDSSGTHMRRSTSGSHATWDAWTPVLDKKLSNTNISTYISEAAIGNAYIADLNADKITAGTISADRIGANSITAGKIDSRNLTIKDENDNVIFSAGNANTFKNNQITVSNGQLTGIGTTGVQVDNSYQQIGQNLIPNSDQTVANTWTLNWNPNSTEFTTVVGYSDVGTGWTTANYVLKAGTVRSVFSRQTVPVTGTVGGSGNSAIAGDFNPTGVGSNLMPVIPGERVCASCYVASHRCNFSIVIVYIDSAGSQIASPESQVYLKTDDNANTLSKFTRAFLLDTVPANSAAAYIVVRKYNTYAGQNDSYIWMAAPQFEKTNTNATGPSPYQPGPASDATQLLSGGRISSSNIGTYIQSASVDTLRIAGTAVTVPLVYEVSGGAINNFCLTYSFDMGVLTGEVSKAVFLWQAITDTTRSCEWFMYVMQGTATPVLTPYYTPQTGGGYVWVPPVVICGPDKNGNTVCSEVEPGYYSFVGAGSGTHALVPVTPRIGWNRAGGTYQDAPVILGIGDVYPGINTLYVYWASSGGGGIYTQKLTVLGAKR